LALRGQENPPQELLDFRYRERFHMTQEELENEPEDIYNLNLSIIAKINELSDEAIRHQETRDERNSRFQ